MNAKTALCMALLDGRVLNVSNCHREVGLTNIAREIPRMVEDEFHVEVSRTPRSGKNRYGSPTSYVDYRLNHTEHNKEGIALMRQYVQENQEPGMKPKRPVGRPKTVIPESTTKPLTLF